MTLAHQYPLGPLSQLPAGSRTLDTLERFTVSMEGAVTDWHTLLDVLNAEQLTCTYRPGSWMVSQLAHHVAEAHLHGLIRLKAV